VIVEKPFTVNTAEADELISIAKKQNRVLTVFQNRRRSRAYRWGEDGIGGFSDERQRMCFALALWNGRDPILKERLFGLTGHEGNHGEDVKEYYFYLDSTPTHSFMRMLYKYPQAAFPYADLVEENQRRGRGAPEYELIDTGVFDGDRYFDVFVEYGKVDSEDLLMKITVANRGPEAAAIRVLPTIWFRNTWAWGGRSRRGHVEARPPVQGSATIAAETMRYGRRWLYAEGDPTLLFTDNETNAMRLFGIAGPRIICGSPFAHGSASSRSIVRRKSATCRSCCSPAAGPRKPAYTSRIRPSRPMKSVVG
jgi:hypothetical protein